MELADPGGARRRASAFGLINGYFVAVVGLQLAGGDAGGLHRLPGSGATARRGPLGRNADAFPAWFTDLGQQGLIGPIDALVHHRASALDVRVRRPARPGRRDARMAGSGGCTYVIGNSAPVARFSGVRVARAQDDDLHDERSHRRAGRACSWPPASARCAAAPRRVRARHHHVVLLGGVSIFGGSGTMVGVFLVDHPGAQHAQRPRSSPASPGNTQTGIIGLLLILSVLAARTWSGAYRERAAAAVARPERARAATVERSEA